jgi:hypothetical protein
VGEIIAVTQEEVLERESAFKAVTSHQHLLRRFINRDIGSLNSIYALLRMELAYQAAAHIRLFCENVITLRYILLDPEKRSKAFLDYATIDEFKIGAAYLKWESLTAKPRHVEAMSLQQAEVEKRFTELRGRYVTSKGREFRNWCNLSLKTQAEECGANIQRLYEIGYQQLSAYVHGSAWALRRQEAYIRTTYDQTVVMIDFANLTRILLAVWTEWLTILSEELGWQALRRVPDILDRCNKLDEATMQAVANIRKRQAQNVNKSREGAGEEVRCVLCDAPAGEGSKKQFTLSPEAKERLTRMYPGADPEAVLLRNVICTKCLMLSSEERQSMAQKALVRELKFYTGVSTTSKTRKRTSK